MKILKAQCISGQGISGQSIPDQGIPDQDAERNLRVSRRRLLGGIGAGSLATAATVFGFASSASAATVPYGCCHLCCRPTGKTLTQCQTGFHYVWTCAESTGATCQCCEHESPCRNKLCNSTHFSVGVCT
jgi:hypothetical protein